MGNPEFEHIKQRMDDMGICVIIPTYNNQKTVIGVVEEVMRYTRNIIVVNDGSTDQTRQLLNDSALPVTCVHYEKNKGKGHALKIGFLKALDLGYTYAITIDSDGQHFPEDLPLFVEAIKEYPQALIVGSRNLNSENMPGKNTFANKFSNFWFYIQTGQNLKDTQTGYRLYPLKKLRGLNLLTSRYEAELELLVFASWHGVKLHPIFIQVYYPPKGERVSHFRPTADFLRISLLNTVLCLGAIVYGLPLRIGRLFTQKNNR
ncbi:glycosyltransferase family 2 protein [Odoribacter sp. OttesenSCG-928-J03]|nr:glycosyltransferase family 2 protein [Odoribacter sp. OttesenSCG-928-J03]MDL2331244.1 glycosyltransferase family 2 protein [Odoribacter sp. OttesenSCG-928-A06]